jgi:hypothetical protein
MGRPDIWTYNGKAGEVLDIVLKADQPATGVGDPQERVQKGLLDTWLAVRRPDGTILEANDDAESPNTDSGIYGLALPEDGVYIIEVAGYNDLTAGGYTLSAEPVLPEVTPTATVVSTATTPTATPTASAAGVVITLEVTAEPTATPEGTETPKP